MSLIGMPDSRTSGRRLLSGAAARAKSHRVAVATRLIEGQRADALAHIADGSAMLVVGAHGHRPMGRTLVGSVIRGCLQHARCPVAVVGATASAPMVAEAPITTWASTPLGRQTWNDHDRHRASTDTPERGDAQSRIPVDH